jgi:hypothetical protein
VTGSSATISFANSSLIRSGVIRPRSADIAAIAARTSSATVKRSRAANRAARSMRSGSSAKLDSAVPGVRMTRAARSSRPP